MGQWLAIFYIFAAIRSCGKNITADSVGKVGGNGVVSGMAKFAIPPGSLINIALH